MKIKFLQLKLRILDEHVQSFECVFWMRVFNVYKTKMWTKWVVWA